MFNIISSHLLPLSNPLNQDKPIEAHNVSEYVLNFFMRYLLTILLILFLDTESSWLVSLVFNVAVIYCNNIPLDYEENSGLADKIFRNSVVFLFGMRISIMAQSIYVAFYLGILMMVVSMIRIYLENKNLGTYVALFSYCIVLVVYGAFIKSYLTFFIGLSIFYYIIAGKLKPEYEKLLFGFLAGLSLVVFIGFWS